LQILSRSDNFKAIKFSSSIRNDKELSLIQRLASGHVATYGLDKVLKIWSITNEEDMTAKMTHKLKLSKDLLSV
jgi:hypothetical protein